MQINPESTIAIKTSERTIVHWDILHARIQEIKATSPLLAVAVDGPAASGKTTFASLLEKRLISDGFATTVTKIPTDWALHSSTYRKSADFKNIEQDHQRWWRNWRRPGLIHRFLKAWNSGEADFEPGLRYIPIDPDLGTPSFGNTPLKVPIADAVILEGIFSTKEDTEMLFKKYGVHPIKLVVQAPLETLIDRIKKRSEHQGQILDLQVKRLINIYWPCWSNYWNSVRQSTPFVVDSRGNDFVITKNPDYIDR